MLADTTQDKHDDARQTADLPAAGYPISEDAVTHWFEKTYHRMPTDGEVGGILSAMAQRDATSPRVGPSPEQEGVGTGASPIVGR